MSDIIVIAIVAVIVGTAIAYMIKQKRSGVKCIGCPDAKTCSGNCSDCCGCTSDEE